MSSSARRHALLARILRNGTDAPRRCSFCVERPYLRCLVSPDSKRCYECAKRGHLCSFPSDITSPAKFRRVDQQRDRVRAQIEQTQREIERDEAEIQRLQEEA